jgi:hypothetical protein
MATTSTVKRLIGIPRPKIAFSKNKMPIAIKELIKIARGL